MVRPRQLTSSILGLTTFRSTVHGVELSNRPNAGAALIDYIHCDALAAVAPSLFFFGTKYG
jgi:hypothetical protein